MAILLSGDFHANAVQELTRITKRTLVTKWGRDLFNEIRYHVILGDGGFMWPGNEKGDACNYKTLAYRPFPVLCVIGNHEPMLGRTNLSEVDIGIGESVLLVRDKNPFVAYLKRGKVYTIDGFKFLALGGALSIDKAYRRPGLSWWEGEYWSSAEKDEVFRLLKGQKNFDYVLSHTGPDRVNRILFQEERGAYHPKFSDEVAALNEAIDGKIACKGWFCGHWHKDRQYFDEEMKREYRYLYDTTALLREGEL
ncbi:MAG: metallophosphoesterase, partial [Treponema sp.]|nr:metallophosphoesterase [Treponema sp.]